MSRASFVHALAALGALFAGGAHATPRAALSDPAPTPRPIPRPAPASAAAPIGMKPVPNPPEIRPKPGRTSIVRPRRGAAAQANAAARDWPSSAAYINSALFYDFEPGRIYTIQTSPRFLTTIQLRAGERLIAKAAGDTVRWVLGETLAGAGENAQVTIFVKPIRPGLRTNIVLTTDQRTYLIDASSNALASYTSVLAWNYPHEDAQAAEAARVAQATQARALISEAACATSSLSTERLNFRYRIDPRSRRRPDWTPVRVFDDGQKTCIEFPADLATRAAPPLFLLGDKDRAELVNYRQAGVYYVVDRLLNRAELRLGEKRQDVVRITRQGDGR